MNKVTIEAVLLSPAFGQVAAIEALQFIAKKNNRTMDDAVAAFAAGAPNVVKQVKELVLAAAEALVEKLNER